VKHGKIWENFQALIGVILLAIFYLKKKLKIFQCQAWNGNRFVNLFVEKKIANFMHFSCHFVSCIVTQIEFLISAIRESIWEL
jgi:hypothetical protein